MHPKKEAAKRYRAGDTLRTIGAALGVEPRKVRLWLAEEGVPVQPTGRRSNPVQTEDVEHLLAAGWSTRQVGAELGLAPSAVRVRVLERIPGAKLTDKQVVSLRGKGTTWERLATLSGMSVTGVRARYLRLTGHSTG